MDINFSIQDVSNLNDYISATHGVKAINVKPKLNIATVLALKKNRSLEIEYLIKCDENGAACIVFERLLALPPSNSWAVLAVELMNLLKYWLEVVRKRLIDHYSCWWKFLKLILKFIKEILRKDPSFSNKLVELVSECLLNLATTPKADVYQRHEILHCLNMVCAESGREVRFAMRPKFGVHFAKLAGDMLVSSFFPFQYSALECLLRWLVPRDEPALRVAAADKWLPSHLCPDAARNIFLESNWLNFMADTRCFLNEINNANKQVISVVCKQLIVGKLVLIDGTHKSACWVDLDVPGKSVSVMLQPRALAALGLVEHRAHEALLIDHHITDNVILRRETLGLMVLFKLLRAPYIRPTEVKIEGEDHQVTIVVSSRTDSRTLDLAMTNIFGDKYRALFDLDSDVPQSPQANKIKNDNHSEEDTRFSQPVQVNRQNRCGYAVKSARGKELVSPSSTSTSSLNQLRDKLTALPQFQLFKEPVSVCAEPALSRVSEVSEKDDQSINSTATVKYQPWGVRSFKKSIFYQTKIQERITRSDGESVTQTAKVSRGGRRVLSPVVSEDNNASSLLVATLDSNCSVINETIEQISKSKDFQGDNIVDLLMQQAFQANPKNMEVSDSGINTDDKKSQEDSEAIENTPNERNEGTRSKVPFKKNLTVISKSTTDDESNTETINKKPAFLCRRRNTISQNKPRITVEAQEKPLAVTVENIFSQHVAEIMSGKKIVNSSEKNKKSLDSTVYFDELKSKDKNRDVDVADEITNIVVGNIDPNVITDTNETVQGKKSKISKKKNVPKLIPSKVQKPNMKQKPVKKAISRTIKKTVQQKNNTKKMSTIVEQKEEDAFREDVNPEIANDVVKIKSPEKNNETTPKKASIKEAPSFKKKRKLYSPTDDHIDEDIVISTANTVEKKSDDVLHSESITYNNPKTPKSSAACYKELEKDRKRYMRATRSRKSNASVIEMSTPTLKMNSMFKNHKQSVESNESIPLVDNNTCVYNFTSSDDEDFVIKKIKLKPRTHAGTVGGNKTRKARNTRCIKESESSYDAAKTVRNEKRKRKVAKRNNKQKLDVTVPVVNLVDAKMNPIDERKKESVRTEPNIADTRDGSSSPLPGLIVEESTPKYKSDINDSLSTTMLQKFKIIYQECPKDKIDSVIPQSSTSDSIKSKSPVVSIARTSLEELNQWLPMPKTLEANKNRKKYKPHKGAEPEIEVPVLKLVDESINLIDERMRKAVREGLNTSIVIENPEELTPEDYEPVEPLQMEPIEDIKSDDISVSKHNAKTSLIERNYNSKSNDALASTTKVNKRAKKAGILLDIQEKVLDNTNNVIAGIEDDSISRQISTPNSIKSKSPTVSIARMSFEEFNKWLPMPNDSEATDGITIRNTSRNYKHMNKDDSIHEDIDSDSNEGETTEMPIKHKTRKANDSKATDGITIRYTRRNSKLINKDHSINEDIDSDSNEGETAEIPIKHKTRKANDSNTTDGITKRNTRRNSKLINKDYSIHEDIDSDSNEGEATEMPIKHKTRKANDSKATDGITIRYTRRNSKLINKDHSINEDIDSDSNEGETTEIPIKHKTRKANDSNTTDGITKRNTRRNSKLINKDDGIHEDIDSDSNEGETTELPINVDSVESPCKPIKSTLKISPVKLVDSFACNLESNDSSGDETLTRTKKYSLRPTAKSMKSAESSVDFMKVKSTSPLLSEAKKRRLEHTSHRDNTLPKRLKLDTPLVDSKNNTIVIILKLLIKKLNKKEKQIESLRRLTGRAREMYKDTIVLAKKYVDMDRTMREMIANFENLKASDIEFKKSLLKQIVAMSRDDCHQLGHTLKDNVQDIMETMLLYSSGTDSS